MAAKANLSPSSEKGGGSKESDKGNKESAKDGSKSAKKRSRPRSPPDGDTAGTKAANSKILRMLQMSTNEMHV